jgi:2-methylisocitrate lyase-like PEP mutase family enzyme
MADRGSPQPVPRAASPGSRLRNALERERPLVLPGCPDALTARLAEAVGFEAVYLSGAGLANALLGRPDVGLTTMTELVEQAARICDVIQIPLVVDIDTGFGNALNAQRTVRAVERAGAAAVQIEDQVFPKRCGHFARTDVVSFEEMSGKLRAVLDARVDPELVVIARTDALAARGFEAAVERAIGFAELGADVVFVEAPRSVEELQALPRRIPAPLLVNIVEGGRTPHLGAAELGVMGYRIVLFANTALRIAARAARDALQVLRATGDSRSLLVSMLTWNERQALVGLPEIERLEERYRGS